MSELAFASEVIAVRQVLAQGHVSEMVTNRGLTDFSVRLRYSHADGAGLFDTTQSIMPGGYFALHLLPGSNMPDLSAAGSVTLALEFTGIDTGPAELTVAGSDLAVVTQERMIAGQQAKLRRIAGAPFTFPDIAVEPAPLMLDGLLLYDNDPDQPAGNVAVTLAGGPALHTDAQGRFRIDTLPLAAIITLQFDDGSPVKERAFRPTWGRGPMTRIFSIPSPSIPSP